MAKKQEHIEIQDEYTSEYRRAAQKWENQLIGLEQEFVEAVRKLANWPENERDSDLWNDIHASLWANGDYSSTPRHPQSGPRFLAVRPVLG